MVSRYYYLIKVIWCYHQSLHRRRQVNSGFCSLHLKSTFGSINTVDRVDEHNPIDNIITSSNIAITNAYSMYEWIGNSDHLPIVAELTIDPDAKSQVNTNQTTEDGFIDGYYKPTPKQDIAERE